MVSCSKGRSFVKLTGLDLLKKKSLKMSQTCDSRLLNFMECCISLVSASVSFCKVWVVPPVIYTTVTFLRRTEGFFLQATGFLFCPGILPCGDKTMQVCYFQSCIHRTALFMCHTVYKPEKYHSLRFTIHVESCIYDQPRGHFLLMI